MLKLFILWRLKLRSCKTLLDHFHLVQKCKKPADYFKSGIGDSSHLIGRHVLSHNSRTRVFLDMRFLQNDGESSHPSICTIWTKSLELFLRKMTRNDKNPILTPFLPQNSRTRIFFQNRAPSLFCIYGPLTSCKKSEKSLEPISVTLCH